MSQREPKRESEGQKGPKRANDYHYQREPEGARESQRNPESARNWARVIPERARERQRLQASCQKEKVVANLSGSLSGSPWFSLACSLSLSGSNWLSVASTNTLCYSLAQSGSLWLFLAHYCSELRLYSPCSALSAAATLTHILRSASAKCVTILKYLSKFNAL